MHIEKDRIYEPSKTVKETYASLAPTQMPKAPCKLPAAAEETLGKSEGPTVEPLFAL